MRAVPILMLGLAAPLVAGNVQATPAGKKVCPDHFHFTRSAQPQGAHPLGAEPNAKLILTVHRTENGCLTPLIVRDNIGPRRP